MVKGIKKIKERIPFRTLLIVNKIPKHLLKILKSSIKILKKMKMFLI